MSSCPILGPEISLQRGVPGSGQNAPRIIVRKVKTMISRRHRLVPRTAERHVLEVREAKFPGGQTEFKEMTWIALIDKTWRPPILVSGEVDLDRTEIKIMIAQLRAPQTAVTLTRKSCRGGFSRCRHSTIDKLGGRVGKRLFRRTLVPVILKNLPRNAYTICCAHARILYPIRVGLDSGPLHLNSCQISQAGLK